MRLLRQADLSACCQGAPPPLLRQGIAEFNRREFFQQHETLEALWRAEPGACRYLYQGIIQVGVAFLHLGRGNFHGAVTKLQSGLALLAAFEPMCLGVDVACLRRQAAACLERLQELGPTRLDEFDWARLPEIRMGD